jgi:hypothetical protein
MWVRSARACTLQLWGLSHTKDYGNVQQLSLTILTTPEIGKYKHGNSCRIQNSKYQVYLHFQQAATTRSMYKSSSSLPCHSVPFPIPRAQRSPDLHTTNVVARGVWRVASGKPHPDVTLDIHFHCPKTQHIHFLCSDSFASRCGEIRTGLRTGADSLKLWSWLD